MTCPLVTTHAATDELELAQVWAAAHPTKRTEGNILEVTRKLHDLELARRKASASRRRNPWPFLKTMLGL